MNSDSYEIESEILRWKTKWEKQDVESRHDTLLSSLKECLKNYYQNIFTLLQILSKLPVTTSENEHSLL